MKPKIRAYSNEYYLFCFWDREEYKAELKGLSLHAKAHHMQKFGLLTAIIIEKEKQSLN